jgi:NAD(P)-dependent dehydrogenase (short-subunit alcohol dehydrogenase family)
MDVTDEEQTRSVVHAIAQKHGGLHGAFNNAGTNAEITPALRSPSHALDRTFDVNVRGLWICMQAQLDAMFRTRSQGAIVNCSSIYAAGAVPLAPLYAASKAAVDSLTLSFAALAAPRRITVNCVRPGYTVPSDMLEQFASQLEASGSASESAAPTGVADAATASSASSVYAELSAGVPRPHMVAAVQIAHQVAYYMHPLSNMVTGQCASVCGGESLRSYAIAGLTPAQIADLQEAGEEEME